MDSVAGTARALGFGPELSSDTGPWRALSLQVWHGHSPLRFCACAPFRDVVVGYHTGGPALRVQFDGKWMRRLSRPGQITITPPGTPVTWDVSGELQSCTLHIAPERFANLVGDASPDQLVDSIGFEFAAQDGLLSGALSALVRELQQPSALGSLYVDTLSDTVALHLLQRAGSARPLRASSGGLSRRAVRIALEVVESAVESGVSLDALAAASGMSRSHFTRSFRSSFGCSPHQYLRRRRIERAKALLQRSGPAIAQIAAQCGFASQAHLTDAFRHAIGVTPLTFRRGWVGDSD